ncbi:MAG: peptide deformylase [Bacteroidetes bacterium]|nr:peptide deformylase [Bacteroidota bacterium]MDA1336242.1 peptide deformylase [Bacteroidota bacterium]
MILPIVAYGDAVLKKEADDVGQEFQGLDELVNNMWETMYQADGVGLAAPQVGLSLRIFVCDGTPFAEGEKGDASCLDFKRVMINPVIFDESEERSQMEEGCLSIPGIREAVERPETISVEYYNEKWELKEERLSGLAARIVQHENDHLDGVLITDHVNPMRRRLLHGKLRDITQGKVPVDYRMKKV